MKNAQQAPTREGWFINRLGDKRPYKWKAVRAEPLNAWQMAHGCHGVVFADSLGELEMQLTAESIKDELICLAMSLVTAMREADRQRTVQAMRRRE